MKSRITATTGSSGLSSLHTMTYAPFPLRYLETALTWLSQIATKLSQALGRKIEHVKLDEESRYKSLVQAGVSEYYSRILTTLEVKASRGSEAVLGDDVEKVTGHPPKSFGAFATENKALWLS